MANPITPDQLVSALRAEGIRDIVQMEGWRTHNRNHVGRWGPVNGITIHHTAGVGAGLARYCYHGTAGLPGPLCHAFLAKTGTLYLVGHGRANHAGTFTQSAHDAVVAESSTHPRPAAGEPEVVDGNRHYYGLEIENNGDGHDPYPDLQYSVAVRWATALARFHGWTEHSVIGHKEGTRRKIDPSFPMDLFRRNVRSRLEESDDMPLTDADLRKIAVSVWGYKNTALDPRDMRQHVADIDTRVKALDLAGMTDAQVRALSKAVGDEIARRMVA